MSSIECSSHIAFPLDERGPIRAVVAGYYSHFRTGQSRSVKAAEVSKPGEFKAACDLFRFAWRRRRSDLT
jgi:hypothetical protein